MTVPQPPLWSPSPDDVGAVVARFAPDLSGVVTGHFTTSTVPTAVQVLGIIGGATAEVDFAAGPVPAQAELFAGRVAALGAALQVVTAFFPETPAAYLDRLTGQYETALGRLTDGVARLDTQTPDGGGEIEVWSVLDPAGRPELCE